MAKYLIDKRWTGPGWYGYRHNAKLLGVDVIVVKKVIDLANFADEQELAQEIAWNREYWDNLVFFATKDEFDKVE